MTATRFVFAVAFHEYPTAARQMVADILRHYPDGQVRYAVDHPRGRLRSDLPELVRAVRRGRLPYRRYLPDGALAGLGPRVRRVPQKRAYSWRNLQRFLFDVAEDVAGEEYDYLVLADSDAAFTGPGLAAVADGTWDFSHYRMVDPDGGGWGHGRTFMQHWDRYAEAARAAGLTPEPRGLGTMFALLVLSRRAVDRLLAVLPVLEAHPGYRFFEEVALPQFVFYEALIPQLLGDLGLVPRLLTDDTPGYRWRPHWTPAEYRPDVWFYHPVTRRPWDPFRRLLRAEAVPA